MTRLLFKTVLKRSLYGLNRINYEDGTSLVRGWFQQGNF
jgi:hypothetical protein